MIDEKRDSLENGLSLYVINGQSLWIFVIDNDKLKSASYNEASASTSILFGHHHEEHKDTPDLYDFRLQ
jgi:hypothetical protein